MPGSQSIAGPPRHAASQPSWNALTVPVPRYRRLAGISTIAPLAAGSIKKECCPTWSWETYSRKERQYDCAVWVDHFVSGYLATGRCGSLDHHRSPGLLGYRQARTVGLDSRPLQARGEEMTFWKGKRV